MKSKHLYFVMIISISLLLSGCTQSLGTKDSKSDFKKYITADVKTLGNLQEDFSLISENNKLITNGIDKQYKDLSGYKDVLNLYSIDGTNETILYNADFKSGSFRVLLVKANGEAIDITKENGDGSVNVSIPSGKSTIKLIGSNAAGRLKIGIPSTSNSELKQLGDFNQDGEYTFWKSNGTSGDNYSISFYHLNVVNKKIDKLAKIELKGKITGGKVVTSFDDDGWGNSGTAEIAVGANGTSPEIIVVNIKNKNFKSAQWGISEGTFTPTDEQLPDFLKDM